MAVRQRFVNTDSTAGGDGTTNNTTGATRAYATLDEARINEAADLVAAGDNLVIDCSAPGGVADTVRAQFTAGYTTSPTNNITIRGEGQDEWDTNKYRVDILATGNSHRPIDMSYDAVIEDIQARVDSNGNNNCVAIRSANEPCIIRRSIGIIISPGTELNVFGIIVTTSSSEIRSCLVYKEGGSAYGTGIEARASIYNCTADNFDSGFNGLSANDYRNCIASAAGTAGWIGNVGNANSTNNVSDQNDAPGANPTNGTPTYVNAAGGDFRPAAGDTIAKDTGVDLSGTFDYDLENISFGATWDRGCLNAVSDPAMTLSVPTATSITTTGTTPRVTTDEAGGNLWAYAVSGLGQTPNHATIKANAQSTSTAVLGVNTMPAITGLTPDADYTLAFAGEDTGLNESTPVYVDFSTLALTATVVLRNLADGSLFANETSIEYAVWDNSALGGIGAPSLQSNTGSTNASGELTFSYGSAVDQNGIVLARKVVAGADNTNDQWAAGGILAE